MKTLEELIEAEANKKENELMELNPGGFHVSNYCNRDTLSDFFILGAKFVSENPTMIPAVLELVHSLEQQNDFFVQKELDDTVTVREMYKICERTKLAIKNLGGK